MAGCAGLARVTGIPIPLPLGLDKDPKLLSASLEEQPQAQCLSFPSGEPAAPMGWQQPSSLRKCWTENLL